jgi:hypothetical protein
MKESLVESLKKLGLTEYEAKVYAALVGLGEATAGRFTRRARSRGPGYTMCSETSQTRAS